MGPDVHISWSFDANEGAAIAAAFRVGERLEGKWDWRRTLVRWVMRLLCVPMDVSAGVIRYGLKSKIDTLQPRRVYIHWIGHEMLRYEELECLRGIPVTIVLHDFSLFEKPPYRKETWFDRWRLKRIHKVLSALELDFEAPSEWAGRHIKELWPNARVAVKPTPVRESFCRCVVKHGSSSDGRFKLLFGCQGGRANPYKGFSELEEALKMLPCEVKSKLELHIFGESAEECLTSGVHTVFHGEIGDDEELARLYRGCDAFAFPSLSETQGLVKDEAIACGLKVIVFNMTACPEGVCHLENGFVAENVAGFAKGIEWAMSR